jgi:hypothetical protein
MAQWHPSRNFGIDARQLTARSDRMVWWICGRGHEWRALCANRARGVGCPVCAGKVVVIGFNDVETTHPEIAMDWHPKLNGDVKPSDVIAGSHKKYWWICVQNHEWQASLKARAKGTGCPSCAGHGYDSNSSGILYFMKNSVLGARKIGITNSSSTRLEVFRRNGWVTLATFERENGSTIKSAEAKLFRWLRVEIGLPEHLGKEEMRGPEAGPKLLARLAHRMRR